MAPLIVNLGVPQNFQSLLRSIIHEEETHAVLAHQGNIQLTGLG